MIANKYKVPQRLWKGFKECGQVVYNQVYLSGSQANLTHPKADKVPKAHWDTIRHNFACLAAWAARDSA